MRWFICLFAWGRSFLNFGNFLLWRFFLLSQFFLLSLGIPFSKRRWLFNRCDTLLCRRFFGLCFFGVSSFFNRSDSSFLLRFFLYYGSLRMSRSFQNLLFLLGLRLFLFWRRFRFFFRFSNLFGNWLFNLFRCCLSLFGCWFRLFNWSRLSFPGCDSLNFFSRRWRLLLSGFLSRGSLFRRRFLSSRWDLLNDRCLCNRSFFGRFGFFSLVVTVSDEVLDLWNSCILNANNFRLFHFFVNWCIQLFGWRFDSRFLLSWGFLFWFHYFGGRFLNRALSCWFACANFLWHRFCNLFFRFRWLLLSTFLDGFRLRKNFNFLLFIFISHKSKAASCARRGALQVFPLSGCGLRFGVVIARNGLFFRLFLLFVRMIIFLLFPSFFSVFSFLFRLLIIMIRLSCVDICIFNFRWRYDFKLIGEWFGFLKVRHSYENSI